MKWNKHEEMADGKTFIGEIVGCEDIEGDYGPQVQIDIKPLDHEIQGETGCYHEWLPHSNSKNSKMGEFVNALNEAGVFPEDNKDLIGVKGEWEESELVFEGITDDEGNPKTVKCKLLRRQTDEAGNDVGGGAKLKKVESSDYDFSELDTLLKKKDEDGVYTGMSHQRITKWARRQGIPQPNVNKYLDANAKYDEEDEVYFIE